MPNDQGAAGAEIRSQITRNKSELEKVLQVRRETEAAAADLEQQLRALVNRRTEVGSQEGTLRKEIGDLQNTLDALGRGSRS